MKIGIYINKTKDNSTCIYKQVEEQFASNCIDYIEIEDLTQNYNVDMLLVLGGDGTILRVINFALKFNLPLLSINIGSLGFLSTVESSNVHEIIEIIKAGKFKMQERSVLQVVLNGKFYYALNDAVIEKSKDDESVLVAKLKLQLNNKLVNNFVANGLIISTPSGSTAYSLSAGGCILAPNVKAMIATPICAHSLSVRPVVYNEDAKAVVTLKENSSKCALYIDGQKVDDVMCGQSITVTKHKQMLNFIDNGTNFFNKLMKKL